MSGEPEPRARVECHPASPPMFPSHMPPWGLFNHPPHLSHRSLTFAGKVGSLPASVHCIFGEAPLDSSRSSSFIFC